MPSYYSIITYVPDPIADERINIGVVVFGDGRPQFRFVSDWRRAFNFGRIRTDVLQDFAAQVKSDQRSVFSDLEEWDEDTLRNILARWKNSVQFTEPRASIKPPNDLLNDVARLYLHASERPRKAVLHNRTYAVDQTYKTIKEAVSARFGAKVADSLVARRAPLQGRIASHDFDVVVANGAPYVAALGLSFRVRETQALDREVDAAAFAASDLLNNSEDIHLAVMTVNPLRASESYDRARKTFSKLSIPSLSLEDAHNWANEVVSSLRL